MSAKRSDTLCLRSPKQLAALASPVRIEIVGVFQTHGACSVRELAERLDRPADGLYHHIRRLVEAGVLRQQESRRAGRRPEAVYALTASRVGGALDASSRAGRQMGIRTATMALRLAAREFGAAVESGEPACAGDVPRLRASRQKAWLTPEGLSRLNRLLGRIERLLAQHNRRKQGRIFALTTVLVPVIKKRRI